MGKKRKSEEEAEDAGSLHQAFVEAANAVSKLYFNAQGSKDRRLRAARAAGARSLLERQVQWLRQYSATDAVPLPVILAYLQQEAQRTAAESGEDDLGDRRDWQAAAEFKAGAQGFGFGQGPPHF